MSQRPRDWSASSPLMFPDSPNSYTMNLGAARSTLACKVKSLALRRGESQKPKTVNTNGFAFPLSEKEKKKKEVSFVFHSTGTQPRRDA